MSAAVVQPPCLMSWPCNSHKKRESLLGTAELRCCRRKSSNGGEKEVEQRSLRSFACLVRWKILSIQALANWSIFAAPGNRQYCSAGVFFSGFGSWLTCRRDRRCGMVFRCLRKSTRRVENSIFPLYWSRLCGEDRHCTQKNPTSLGTATEHVSTFSFPQPYSGVVTFRFLPWNGHFLGVFFRFPLILRPSQSNWSVLELGFECTRVAAFRPMNKLNLFSWTYLLFFAKNVSSGTSGTPPPPPRGEKQSKSTTLQ